MCGLYTEEQLEQERRALGDIAFSREYLGIPGGGGVSPFGWELYDRATRVHVPPVSHGPTFGGRQYNVSDVYSWPLYKPIIERRPTRYGLLLVYTIGRTILLEMLQREFESDLVRLGTSPEIRRGFEQLAKLEVEYREGGTLYQSAPGQHDDLGISFAMLNWAAQHPHLDLWMRDVGVARQPRRRAPSKQDSAWAAFT